MISTISRALRGRVGTLAGIALIAVLMWRLGTGPFMDGLRRIDGLTLLAALGIGLLTTVFSAWRWCLVARALNVRLPLGRAVADYYRALFLNAALPGGVLGDVNRAVRHGKNAGDIARGVRAVVLERTAGQVVLIAAGVLVLVADPSPALTQTGHLVAAPDVLRTLAVLGGLALAVAVTAVVLRKGPAVSLWHRVVRALRGELAEARLGLLGRASWPGVVLSSAAVLAGHLGMFLLAARVAGSRAPVAELLPLMMLALIAMALPLNIGGWGPREGVTAWAFGAAGLGASQGLSVAVVYGVLAFAAALPGIGVLAVQWLAGRRSAAGLGQLELEERVLTEGGTPHRRPERVPHHVGAGEAQPRHAVADKDRGHGDVQTLQRPLVQEA
ncbi:lysylphosphatidylglycerol synthase transmembrane domain-containing protein [Streptomyces sp. NBC_01262]|uniref:lysylphosphatidylglycerol synthase transmembrane domain-containing protein n=1 Tax=Streptomyces sp. NBC_01262 TaxID=2903803 RepID=UPI002E303C15|nr:lysylphosphatidylglycerol synthase transmembrane domain-containing protein [Streptomyces sp. NBC_01262]